MLTCEMMRVTISQSSSFFECSPAILESIKVKDGSMFQYSVLRIILFEQLIRL